MDGINIGSEDTTYPYSIIWNSTTVADGIHILSAVARDSSGNITTVTKNIMISNTDKTPSTVTITSPANGTKLTTNTTIKISASDDQYIYSIDILVDGILKTSCFTYNVAPRTDLKTFSCSYILSLSSITSGNHTIQAKAYDRYSNPNVGTTSIIIKK